jgi:hypothetical protein
VMCGRRGGGVNGLGEWFGWLGWDWMGLDGIGWDWMGLDGIGWDWMGLDGIGLYWKGVLMCDGGGCGWAFGGGMDGRYVNACDCVGRRREKAGEGTRYGVERLSLSTSLLRIEIYALVNFTKSVSFSISHSLFLRTLV